MEEADSHVSEIAGWSIPKTINPNATAARIGRPERLEGSIGTTPLADIWAFVKECGWLIHGSKIVYQSNDNSFDFN